MAATYFLGTLYIAVPCSPNLRGSRPLRPSGADAYGYTSSHMLNMEHRSEYGRSNVGEIGLLDVCMDEDRAVIRDSASVFRSNA
jgi:hypothetical protein